MEYENENAEMDDKIDGMDENTEEIEIDEHTTDENADSDAHDTGHESNETSIYYPSWIMHMNH